MGQNSSKRDWIDVVDGLLLRTDRALDRFRKTPRRRLEVVPTPLVPVDPFGPAPATKPAAAAAAPAEPPPLGDPGLPAQIYGKRTDDVTGRAVQMLREASVVARMIELDDPDNVGLENRLVRETKRYELPYVYVRGKYVGGFKELAALVKSGSLS